MEDQISKPKKKHFFVEIKYDDPYQKIYKSNPLEARSPDRAVVFAFRAFKKTRPRKRMPKVLNFKTIQI